MEERMSISLRAFIQHLPVRERRAIDRRVLELRAVKADFEAFDRIMGRPTPPPERPEDRMES